MDRRWQTDCPYTLFSNIEQSLGTIMVISHQESLPDFISRNPEVKPEDVAKMYLERRALKRFGMPEEMVRAALFPVYPQGSWITGIARPVDGLGLPAELHPNI